MHLMATLCLFASHFCLPISDLIHSAINYFEDLVIVDAVVINKFMGILLECKNASYTILMIVYLYNRKYYTQ